MTTPMNLAPNRMQLTENEFRITCASEYKFGMYMSEDTVISSVDEMMSCLGDVEPSVEMHPFAKEDRNYIEPTTFQMIKYGFCEMLCTLLPCGDLIATLDEMVLCAY